MNDRDRVIALLTRAVRDGWLTEEEAHDLLARYDQGEGIFDAPLELEDAITGIDQETDRDWLAAAVLLGLAFISRTNRVLIHDGHFARMERANQTQTDFEINARALAEGLANGVLTVAEWQAEMSEELRYYITAMYQLGLSVPADQLTATQLTRLSNLIRQEQAYLSRFADQIAVKLLQGNKLSGKGLALRSWLYAGSGRGLFFAAEEEAQRLQPGWVCYYEAIGDTNTCIPCRESVGYYLPTQGPMPGQVCLGHGRCRCRRLWLYDPQRYQELTRA